MPLYNPVTSSGGAAVVGPGGWHYAEHVLWMSNATAAVAAQGLNVPAADTEFDATRAGAQHILIPALYGGDTGGTDFSQYEWRLEADVNNIVAGNTITWRLKSYLAGGYGAASTLVSCTTPGTVGRQNSTSAWTDVTASVNPDLATDSGSVFGWGTQGGNGTQDLVLIRLALWRRWK